MMYIKSTDHEEKGYKDILYLCRFHFQSDDGTCCWEILVDGMWMACVPIYSVIYIVRYLLESRT